MNADRWSLVQSLFDAALEKEPSMRVTFLKEACAQDLELYREVSALLESDQWVNTFLDGVAMDAVSLGDALDHDTTLPMGTSVGPYMLERLIGQGGMGAVYLAERSDGHFEQKVALKVVKRGMDTDEIIKRFKGERQILARLQHKSVARLLDGGVTEDGLPYFAMEYIEGDNLTSHCKKKELDIESRLRLFLQVCEAVDYAHRNLVVHRDLKPANILVVSGEQVKLLDFGIAKWLTGGDVDPDAAITRAGQRVLTPEYAAPEQVRNQTITTATDVYALGVILFELLTGERPYQLTSHNPVEVETVICNTQPEAPSKRVLKNKRPLTKDDTATSLARKLRGDLDVICLKALQKDPDRRYATAREMAADLQAHLSGQPISARKDSLGYVAGRFLKRNQLAVSVTAGVLLAFVATISWYTWQLARERDLAQQEAERVAAVSNFLQEIFEYSDPGVSQGEAISARELLDMGADRLDDELADQPEVKASLLDVVGNVYQSLGYYPRAESLISQSLDIRTQLYGEVHEEVSLSMNNLAAVLKELGRLEEAETYYRRSLEIRKQVLAPDHLDISAGMNNLAFLLDQIGEYEEAESLMREALARDRATLPEGDENLTAALNNLASLLHEKGEYDEALPLYIEALDIRRSLFEKHPLLALSIDNLAVLYHDFSEYAKAESLYVEAYEMRKDLFEPGHPDIGLSLNNIAVLKWDQGDLQQAVSYMEDARIIYADQLGERHPDLGTINGNLAGLYRQLGSMDRAESYYREALSINTEAYGEDHLNSAINMNGLALLLHDQGVLEEAEQMHRKVLAILKQELGEDHPYIATSMGNLSMVLRESGKNEEALEVMSGALSLQEQTLEAGHPDLGRTQFRMAMALRDLDRLQESEVLFKEALQILIAALEEDHIDVASVQFAYAKALIKMSRLDEAKSLLETALVTRQAGLPEDHPLIAETQELLQEIE